MSTKEKEVEEKLETAVIMSSQSNKPIAQPTPNNEAPISNEKDGNDNASSLNPSPTPTDKLDHPSQAAPDDHHHITTSEKQPPSYQQAPSQPANIPPKPSPTQLEPTDHNDNDNDPPPPYTIHSRHTKQLLVLFASLSAFFSPLTAQIYLPALPTLSRDLHVSPTRINLTITTYMIFQGLTPSLIGPFADTYGRRPAYILCFAVYIAANIGLACCRNYGSLLAVRCLQSAGSSTTVALCSAVVADVVTSAERGQYIGITAVPIVLAPSLGPVLGGVLAQYLGWRWIFWFLAIAAAVNLAGLLVFFPETCRRIVGDGSGRAPHGIYRTFWAVGRDWVRRRERRRRRRERQRADAGEAGLERMNSSAAVSQRGAGGFKFAQVNPFASLVLLFQKELGVLLLYSGIVFSGFYATATAMPSQFTEIYGLSNVQVGLMYLPMAGGSVVAAFVVGRLLNKNYRRHATMLGVSVDKTREMDLSNFAIERARLELGIPLLVLSTAVTISWGWAMEYRAHLAVPCVLLFLMGIGLVGFNNTVNVLIVDINPAQAGSAVAANNLTRCFIGAASSAAIVPMIDAWGAGGAFTFFGGLYVVFAPSLWLVMHKGIKWRKEIRDKLERKEQKKEEASSG